MSPTSRPEVVPYTPGSGDIAPALEPALSDPDSHFLLIVAAEAGEEGARAAVELAEARAAEGQPTVLADAGFGEPTLHEVLDVPNLEGLADVFEFGASLERVATRPQGRSFEFVAAGAYLAEPARALGSPRWDRLAEELAEESKKMLVFVPAGTPGLEDLSRRVGRAIIVGGPVYADWAAGALHPSCDVVAVLQPATPEPVEEPGEVDESLFADPVLTEPVVFRAHRESRRVPPVLVAALAVVLLVAGWFLVRTFTGSPEPEPEPTPAATPAEPQPEPRPVETPLDFSVAVEAHQDLETAQERVVALRRAEPDLGFYLAPVPISGSVWHRVLAGPVADREAALALLQRLVDDGYKTDFDNWSVRPTEYAFKLGEFADSAEADSVVSALAERGIPAYVVMIRYEPGAPRYRVYGGAFESPATAGVMEEMLSDAGLDAPLIRRVGEPIAVGS